MTTEIPKELDPKQNPVIKAIFDKLRVVMRKAADTGLVAGTSTVRHYKQENHPDFALIKRVALKFSDDPADVIFPIMIDAFVNKDKLPLFSTKGETVPGKRFLTAYEACIQLTAFMQINGEHHYLHPVTMQPLMKVGTIFADLATTIKQFEEQCVFRVIGDFYDKEAAGGKEQRTAFINILFCLKSDFENGTDAHWVAGIRIDGPIRANLNRLFLMQRKKGKEQLRNIIAGKPPAEPK